MVRALQKRFVLVAMLAVGLLLLVLSLLAGLVGLALMLGVVILLSRSAIAPMAKSIQ